MSCDALSPDGLQGIAQALRTVDCLSRQATASSFDRLFGAHGALSQVLTVALGIYVALLALGLLTGRGGLRLSLLTPRALTIGLVLTFATSWMAYQQVVINLAIGAPDEIARVLIGSRGAAVDVYASRLDAIFTSIGEAASAAAPASADAGGKAASLVSPSTVLWLAAFLLLLGTAGLHIVAKLTLAALLAVGPVFIVLALFEATRGLFVGWLKSALMFAVVPLLGVLAGGGVLLLVVPMTQSIAASGSAVTMQMAAGLLLVACVYLALMAISLKVAAVLTSGWTLPRGAHAGTSTALQSANPGAPAPGPVVNAQRLSPPGPALHHGGGDERIRQIVAVGQRAGLEVSASAHWAGGQATARPVTAGIGASTAIAPLTHARQRTHGLVRTSPADSNRKTSS